jgi:ribosomal-protein-alanine N-acetyltransferase
MSAKGSLKHLRKMSIIDLEDVMQGELSAYPYPWKQKNFEDCLANAMYSCWVFEQDQELVGHVILSTAVSEAHLLNLCVYPQIQGKGWGRKLLKEAEWIAKQFKAEACFLEVRDSNHIGISLYQSAGYNEIGLRKDYYPADKGREDAIIMAKDLL